MEETLFTHEGLWIAATCEHLRTWHLRMKNTSNFSEAKLHEGIRDEHAKGAITSQSIVTYANAFDVARGLLKLKDETSPDTEGVRLIQGFLNTTCRKEFGGDFEEKRRAFESLVEKIPKSGARRDKENDALPFVSGLSKFLWSISPDDWTLFDSYVFRGLGDLTVPGRGGKDRAPKKASEQADAFYSKLGEAGFPDAVSRIKAIGAHEIVAERVIDKALWILGDKYHFKIISGLDSKLSGDDRDALEKKIPGLDPSRLGREISKKLDKSCFSKHLSETWGLN